MDRRDLIKVGLAGPAALVGAPASNAQRFRPDLIHEEPIYPPVSQWTVATLDRHHRIAEHIATRGIVPPDAL